MPKTIEFRPQQELTGIRPECRVTREGHSQGRPTRPRSHGDRHSGESRARADGEVSQPREGRSTASHGIRDIPRDTEQTLSQENVEVVRSIFAAWERGDYSSAEWAHPEIAFLIADGPTPGSWTGEAAMAEVWRGALSAFEALRGEADEYRALDDERVLVLMHFTGRGKTSGLDVGEIAMEGLNLFHVRGGRVTRLVLYRAISASSFIWSETPASRPTREPLLPQPYGFQGLGAVEKELDPRDRLLPETTR
jgi:ketosteroid isomerase-like protein